MEQSNAQILKVAIDAAIMSSGNLPDPGVASLVATAEPVAFSAWALESLTALVRLRRRQPRSNPSQMVFPFHDLSAQIPLTKDKAVEIRSATIGILKQSDKFLTAKRKAAIDKPRPNSLHGRIQREIEIMQPYVYGDRRITTEQVHALIAAGTPPAPRDTKMSEAMKRYWEGMTPEERSFAQQERQAKRRRRERGAAGGR